MDVDAAVLRDQQQGDAFSDLADAFSSRLQELKRFALLRVEDKSKDAFIQDLVGLEGSVRALEKHVQELGLVIEKENATVPKMAALAEACRLQAQCITSIQANLPARLPSLPVSAAGTSGMAALVGHAGASGAGGTSGRLQSAGQDGGAAASTTGRDAGRAAGTRPVTQPQAPQQAPRRYVTEAELQGVSSYMRGRLTLDKVNGALDEAIAHADANARLMAAVRAGGAKLAINERKRGVALMHGVAAKEGVRGHFWFTDSDLRAGTALKNDKTGKAILTILRHLGRLQEVRCTVEGASLTVYPLQAV